MNQYSLSFFQKTVLWIISFILVAFGQPAWHWWIGLIASIIGYALFFRVLLDLPVASTRFLVAFGWMASVQVVQISWMASHPYFYIYGVILFCGWLTGLQFGLFALLIHPHLFQSAFRLLAATGFWIILEWSRLFVLSGLAFNQSGLALTGSIYPLQLASIGGIYFLSFWVMMTNLFVLRTYMEFSKKNFSYVVLLISFPYLFGLVHLSLHNQLMKQSSEKDDATLSALLVQTAFAVEEKMSFQSAEEFLAFVMQEWHQILTLVHQQSHREVELVVLPENVVPYGTYYPALPLNQIEELFYTIFGERVIGAYPELKEPYAAYLETYLGPRWLVSNAFVVQTIANLLKADVVIGLEDSVQLSSATKELYSAAFHFSPYSKEEIARYEKRVLVPMGEYIPFEFCRSLAARYGIQGSFTAGQAAKVFKGKIPFGPSICYEELYGNLMRENRVRGAQLLVNLTNDGWYPNSLLPQQHFDHSRLRTVENGIPLLRACNTGVTGGIDSLGQIIAVLGEDSFKSQHTPGSLYLQIPTYHYQTFYAKFGDSLILSFCFLLMLLGVFKWKN